MHTHSSTKMSTSSKKTINVSTINPTGEEENTHTHTPVSPEDVVETGKELVFLFLADALFLMARRKSRAVKESRIKCITVALYT